VACRKDFRSADLGRSSVDERSETPMTDPRPYRERRTDRPAEGPAQDDEDRDDSLPPGAGAKPDLGPAGDVNRALPYEGDPAPERMVDQPLETDDRAGGS
jgi:hypothetical protein